jgi:drug/metabolite transporter (DMT)-like permease
LHIALEILMFFGAGLFGRTRSTTAPFLRILALLCALGAPACFVLTSYVNEAMVSVLVNAGTVLVAAFLILICWCAFIIGRERRKE